MEKPIKRLNRLFRTKSIAIIIPTYKRTENIRKIIELICNKCTIKGLDIMIVDDDPDTKKVSIISEESFSKAEGCGNRLYELKNRAPHGITYARNFALKSAIGIGADHIIYLDDDAFPGKACFERLLALQIQEPRFAVAAVAGGYTRFWRDFKKNSVKFYTSLGVCYCFLADAVEKVGCQDTKLIIRADHEYVLRMWKNGYWSAAVRAPITHKRFSEREDGKAIPKNNSPEWISDAKYIQSKYPDMVRITKNGNIIPTFVYPTDEYLLEEDLNLLKQ